MTEFIKNLVQSELATIHMVDILESFSKYLLMSSGDFGSIQKIYGIILPIGLLFLTFYFLVSLIQQSTERGMSSEQVIASLVKLAIGTVFINNLDKIVVALCSFSNYLIQNLTFETLDGAKFTELEATEGNVIVMICQAIVFLLPYLLASIAHLGIYGLLLVRKIEIVARCVLAPIGCADIINGGWNSQGIRYIKHLFAVIMQGPLIGALEVASVSIFNNCVTDIIPDTLKAYAALVYGFILLGVIKGANSMSKELFG